MIETIHIKGSEEEGNFHRIIIKIRTGRNARKGFVKKLLGYACSLSA